MSTDTNRIAPVQGYPQGIPWWLHLEAFVGYAARYGTQQSAERLAERGGFGTKEMDRFVPGWRDRIEAFGKMKAELTLTLSQLKEALEKGDRLEKENDELRAKIKSHEDWLKGPPSTRSSNWAALAEKEGGK